MNASDWSSPLHHVGDSVRSLLLAVPMPVVRVLFVALLVVVWICVLRVRQPEQSSRSESQGRWDENLKLWASLALIIQIVIYSLL